MPRKSDRRVPLPAGLLPLLTQGQLETYYDVSESTVMKWVDAGMPVIRLQSSGERKQIRRFDLSEVKAWMAEREQLAAAS